MADPDRLARIAQAQLFLCTPARPDLEDFLSAVLAAGVDAVQLREKGLEARQELELCERVADVAARYDALWAVNDRADVAYLARPDALHLGQDDLPVEAARYLLGTGLLIGRSVHDEEQVRAAAVEPGVDYLFVGPSLPTPTRPDHPSAGLDLVRRAAELRPLRPWFADGGITDLEALDRVLEAGARRVVVVRALTQADDPGAVARQMKQRLTAAGTP